MPDKFELVEATDEEAQSMANDGHVVMDINELVRMIPTIRTAEKKAEEMESREASDIVSGVMSRPLTLVSKADESDDEERYVLAIVLEPNDGADGVPLEPDAQGDIYSAEDIRLTAHEFMSAYRRIGLQHQIVLPTNAVVIVESFLAPADFEMETTGGETYSVRKGTWFLGLKVIDDGLWADVKAGKLTGLSMEGFARNVKERVSV